MLRVLAVVVDTAARALTRAGGPSIVPAALLARIVTLGARIDRGSGVQGSGDTLAAPALLDNE